MQDAAAMRMLDGARHGRHELRQGPPIAAELVDPLAEAATGDKLHRKEWPPAVLADFVDWNDLRMTEPCDGAGFDKKPLAVHRRFADIEHHLQGDDAIQT